ncbi:hypothetical protein [Fervidibacillus halotolerans]|uniref:PilZ domain-containing protein n=1 Tax=Fervidibacillus halotolerans TaxID=2980027 RepID=A0A9E8LZA2_9BACI|nr:hypothetical protein [Fervidibacillus halotolerans]WAA12035.1 hypothetical protein OE105_10675 [Fervidibacillus halotolerans]
MFTLFSTVVLSLTQIASIYLILKYKKLLYTKDVTISELYKYQQSFESLLKQRKRRNLFRAKVQNGRCEFYFSRIDGKPVVSSKKNKGIGKIVDIGYIDMRFMFEHDISVRKNVELTLTLYLENELFHLYGKLIRKEEFAKQHQMIYTIKFTDLYSYDQSRLYQLLRELERKEQKIYR